MVGEYASAEEIQAAPVSKLARPRFNASALALPVPRAGRPHPSIDAAGVENPRGGGKKESARAVN